VCVVVVVRAEVELAELGRVEGGDVPVPQLLLREPLPVGADGRGSSFFDNSRGKKRRERTGERKQNELD
jgi:hypothetical protein